MLELQPRNEATLHGTCGSVSSLESISREASGGEAARRWTEATTGGDIPPDPRIMATRLSAPNPAQRQAIDSPADDFGSTRVDTRMNQRWSLVVKVAVGLRWQSEPMI